jgi:molybdenum cofactor synthesis domain-containing protein
MSFQAKVLTVSTSVAAGRAKDRGGEVVTAALLEADLEVVERKVVADGVDRVENALRELAAGFHGLIVTTGGTGFSPSDTTPEATARVIDRPAPGLAEAMRLTSPLGRLSRATAGTIGAALILNTPGSPNGAAEYLAAVLDVIPHVLSLLGGENPHPHPGQTTHSA